MPTPAPDSSPPEVRDPESPARERVAPEHGRLAQVFHLVDLFPLSVSSIGPVFSVAATGGVMAAEAGWWTLPAIAILALPFIISGFVFRLLNHHFPHAGASYHWSGRIMGQRVARYQAWILILAYFTSIPPIAIPAASYTIALVAPGYHAAPILQLALSLFWILFAAIPLLLGARPTAQITKVFFAVEMIALLAFGSLGLANLHKLAVPVHFGPLPLGGMLVVAVVAATVLDGWEIDSYAAEESRRPKKDPGVSGLVGAFLALGFYAVLYPLMFAETPMRLLDNATDPLAIWANRMLPGEHWAMLIPILASTAGGLWLTTYILTRALYAMGRENLIPRAFSRTSRTRAPYVATVIVLGATLLVTAIETLVTSLSTFFDLILSAAGFFLLAEFFLDSITATVFLTVGHRKLPDTGIGPHSHLLLRAGAMLSTVIMGGLLVTFFIYGPKAIGGGIDWTIAVMILLGFLFAWATGKRAYRLISFRGEDATDPDRELIREGAAGLR